jgi:hypothetical protein
MFDFSTNDLIRLLGIAFALAWLFVRLGLWKGWYWRSRGGVYAYLAFGAMIYLYTYRDRAQEILSEYAPAYTIIMILLAVTCVWWSLRPPSIIKPTWIRWVEAHPKRIRRAMADETEKLDDWQEKVESKESVDEWARSLKRKMPKS